MLIKLEGGHVFDPKHNRNAVGDVWIRDGHIACAPVGHAPDETYDVSGKIVMAGAIDVHSHIAGGNVNTARLLLPENHRAHTPRPAHTPLSTAGWSTFETGCRYALMGFTTVIEPAVPAHQALHSHLELADIPIIDRGLLIVLGDDEFLLSLIREKKPRIEIADYVASMLAAGGGLGIKTVNPGGALAFQNNVRTFDLDDEIPSYGVTSRQITQALQAAVIDLGIPHPLHLHSNNLGLPGNVETALRTLDAAEGRPIHLAHIQFYSYGKEGKRGFSSAAARLAEAVNKASEAITVDVGQVMFRQTVTVSMDVTRQFSARSMAKPRKSVIFDGEINCAGVVPYLYKSEDFHNAVQWACGLELFLLLDNPMRALFTTDHPNGAPYTTYPDLLALLMSRDARAKWLAELPSEAVEMTILPSLTREYSFYEIAAMTRVAPAKLLGLHDRGHLGEGAVADVAVYNDDPDRASMFRFAHLVFKDGNLVVRDGKVAQYRKGKTLTVRPNYNREIDRHLERHYTDLYGVSRSMFQVPLGTVAPDYRYEQVACV